VTGPRKSLALYRGIGRTYWHWARSLIVLAVVVFVPIGLVHSLAVHADIGSLDLDSGLAVLALVSAVAVLAVTGLLGEIFYTGAVSIALTHPHGGEPPTLREVARMVNYRRLVAVDLIFAGLVSIGFVLLFVPGLVMFVFLGLSAPVVEIERRTVRGAFARSVELVRGNFLLVASVLIPIELVGDALINLTTELAQDLLGESLLAEWLADTLSNIAFTPFYAVAAVLLTLELIAARDGTSPRLHSAPPRR
jgi:hypothetical protein